MSAKKIGPLLVIIKLVAATLRTPSEDNLTKLKKGAVLLGLLNPYGNKELLRIINSNKISALSLELLPRISRAQSSDVLSSQANIAGYKAVL